MASIQDEEVHLMWVYVPFVFLGLIVLNLFPIAVTIILLVVLSYYIHKRPNDTGEIL